MQGKILIENLNVKVSYFFNNIMVKYMSSMALFSQI